ncbi:hypothetical protein [Absidia glauca]|uniref:Uncharacterized protein n=1 Tax=Absidia glauca TaxID=4829 RepID=A0A168N0M1_ABSGL|nr:hypothetical protein [Absidia glauca]
MFGSPTAFLLASLSLFSLVAAGGDYAKCETSGGSPWTYDCTNALNKLNKSKCYQLNAQSSGCKNIISYGTCTVAVCVKDDFVFNAPQAAGEFIYDNGYKLADKCGCKSGNCKVGGYYHVEHAANAAAAHGCISTGLGYAHVEFIKH